MSTTFVSSQNPAWHQPLLAYVPFIRALACKAYQGLGAGAREEAIQEVIADTTVGLAGLAAQGRAHFWLIPALADSHRTTPADAACFRVDFEQWLSELPDRHQQLALALAEGERPGDLAKRLKLSPGRISQLRAELRDAWDAFHGELMNGVPSLATL